MHNLRYVEHKCATYSGRASASGAGQAARAPRGVTVSARSVATWQSMV